ncbi:uncharacterized protein CTRU02_208369 [Colletotrichum truncatum]|uniref:Uncharacterized protein n=1 Tax=Colletotrichum truncatum TaxID=5467 RepID=A0ACC3YW54_COLTU|nr:uncharacterized protein CTRU02_07445 [Colletotrichum truncatum]KAF6791105.1 hypothetical protein CTRU02_07445 [Colletotrichum truncatum]
MKLHAIYTTCIVVLSYLVCRASADVSCKQTGRLGSKYWEIKISEVENPAALCGRLWDGLAAWPACNVFRPNGCGTPFGNNDVYLYFTTTIICNRGMVASAFWHATYNRYGPIKC